MVDIKFDELDHERYQEMLAWCNEHFGRAAIWESQLRNPESPTSWYTNNLFDKNPSTGIKAEVGRARFSFKTDKEATLFSLRWS